MDLVSVWLVGLDASGIPAVRAFQPTDIVAAIGAAPADHTHDAMSAMGEQLSAMLSRVSAIESQLASGPTYSAAVNSLLQSADAVAMRQSLGLTGIQLGDFGVQLIATSTVSEAYQPIEEYLEGRSNG